MNDTKIAEVIEMPLATDVTVTDKVLAHIDDMVPGMDVARRYTEFDKPGDKIRGVFIGFKDMPVVDKNTGEQRILNCACVTDGETTWTNGAVMFIDAFRGMPLYTPVEIEFKGTKKTKTGNNMDLFAVRPLEQPK